MSKRGDIWMPLYIADYLGDTTHLTTAQHGAYLLLLMSCWKRGATLPDDDVQLAQIVRCDAKSWRAMRPVIAEFFEIEGGAWTQKRLASEFAKAGGIVGKRSAAGKAGAAKRWGANGGDGGGKPIANAMAKAVANEQQKPSQTDAPSQSPTPKEEGAESEGKGSPEADDLTEWEKRALSADQSALGLRIPSDWKPTPETRAATLRARPDLAPVIDKIADDFRLYALTAVGAAGQSNDWQLSFRRWANREREHRPNGATRSKQSDLEARNAAAVDGWQPPEVRNAAQ